MKQQRAPVYWSISLLLMGISGKQDSTLDRGVHVISGDTGS